MPASASLRIVSLVPAGTEILGLLGAIEQLVGRSHECDYPPTATRAPVLSHQRVAQTVPSAIDRTVRNLLAKGEPLYDLDASALEAARPDVIITQDLCGVCSIDLSSVRRATERLQPAPRIISLNPTSLGDVLDDILRVAEAIDRRREGIVALARLHERIDRAREFVNAYEEPPPLTLLEWTDPLFVAGHWSAELVALAGARPVPVPPAPNGRYGPSTRVSGDDLNQAGAEYLVICPCGFDLHKARRCAADLARADWWDELPAVRAGRVAVVDGSAMFNRPGPRLVDALEWLVGFVQRRPEIMPPGFPWELIPPTGIRYAGEP